MAPAAPAAPAHPGEREGDGGAYSWHPSPCARGSFEPLTVGSHAARPAGRFVRVTVRAKPPASESPDCGSLVAVRKTLTEPPARACLMPPRTRRRRVRGGVRGYGRRRVRAGGTWLCRGRPGLGFRNIRAVGREPPPPAKGRRGWPADGRPGKLGPHHDNDSDDHNPSAAFIKLRRAGPETCGPEERG